MALTPEEIDKVNKEFDKLVNKLDELDQRALLRTKQSLSEGKITLEEWNREVSRFKTSLDQVSNSLSYATTAFKNITDELKGGNTALKSRISSLNKISNIGRQALEVRQGENHLTQKQLENLKLRNERERENLIRLRDSGDIKGQHLRNIEKEIEATKAVSNSIDSIVDRQKEVNRQLGFAPNLAGGLDKALQKAGLPALGIASALEETHKEAQRVSAEGGEAAKKFSPLVTFTKKFGENLKEATSLTNILQAGFLLVLKNVLSLNKAQTDLRRNLGESANTLNLIDNRFGTVADQIGTINSLTEQFGFNTLAAFDAINLREATELTKALGLSAEEAGMLAFNAQVSGENLRDGAKESYKGISPLLSQRKVLQEISKVTPSIALSFKNSNVELAKAASNAKLLGLNLSQVDKIAEGLLDIEQSLTSEFEAEVISGKQLNLERARFFALTNDIDGLTKEIANNQEIINSFSSGTRIEQDAIAGALGLSRDELSKMVQEQAILGKMSAEEIKDKELADAKRLEVQQSLNDSIAKMAEVLAGPVELIADMLVSTKGLLSAFIGIGVAMGTIKTLTAAINAYKRVSIALTKSESIAEAAKVAIKAIGNPLIAVAGLAAGGIAFAAAQGYLKKGDDVMSEGGYGKRTLMGPEGAIALNNNDTVIAGTNLFPNKGSERNTPQNITVTLSKGDLMAMANAVRDGASQANINVNLDGNAVANNLQTPMAMNTRRHGI
jgi:hypothetical protein